MSKETVFTCPTCGNTTTILRKGGFTSHCTCDPVFVPSSQTGRHIEVNFSDNTKTKEKFGS